MVSALSAIFNQASGALQAVDVVLPEGFTSAAPPHVTMSVADGERCPVWPHWRPSHDDSKSRQAQGWPKS